MNRKTAISRILLLGAGAFGVYGGFKAYSLLKSPDFNKLKSSQDLINELAETIIPKDQSPGAKDGNVGQFITKMVINCTERKSQNNFIKGLEDLRHLTFKRYNTTFKNCTIKQKEDVLLYFEHDGHRVNGKFGKAQKFLFGESFFAILKEYTVLGYCTSKAGATLALNYDHIPGQFMGCIDVVKDQRGWATH